jgi:hypothetical protein
MSRLRTVALLAAVIAVLAASFSVGTASAGSDRVQETYRKYALLRERLKSCSLDRAWQHLGSSARKRCRTLRRRYVLYAINGESGTFYVYCRPRTRRCPAAPIGVRDPRKRPPSNATLFR